CLRRREPQGWLRGIRRGGWSPQWSPRFVRTEPENQGLRRRSLRPQLMWKTASVRAGMTGLGLPRRYARTDQVVLRAMAEGRRPLRYATEPTNRRAGRPG